MMPRNVDKCYDVMLWHYDTMKYISVRSTYDTMTPWNDGLGVITSCDDTMHHKNVVASVTTSCHDTWQCLTRCDTILVMTQGKCSIRCHKYPCY